MKKKFFSLPVQLDAIVLLIAVLKLDGEVEDHGNLVSRVAQADVDLPTAVDDSRAVRDKLQAVLEELRLHVRHVFKLLQGDRALQQLPAWVVREVRVDELVGVGQKEILVQLVVKLFRRCLLANDSAGGPVSVDQAPGAVDVDGIPRVLVLSWHELHAWPVVSAFRIAADDLGVEACIPATWSKHQQFCFLGFNFKMLSS